MSGAVTVLVETAGGEEVVEVPWAEAEAAGRLHWSPDETFDVAEVRRMGAFTLAAQRYPGGEIVSCSGCAHH